MLADNKQQLKYSDTTPSINVCAQVESELVSLSEKEQKEYLLSLGVKESGLDQVISKAYDMLGLVSFLTMGLKEVRAWTVKKDTKAPAASRVIHTDFEEKFIKADVILYNDLISAGSREKAKEMGKLRLEGKEYIVQDGDVIEFRIGS
jgi:hypothetical protein